MNKNMKKEFDMEYEKIYSRLYISWKKGIEHKYQELVEQGLITGGLAQMEMYRLIESLVKTCNGELSKMISLFQEKYHRKIYKKDLHHYIEKSKKNITEHIDSMKKDIDEKLTNPLSLHNESMIIYLNNIKQNAQIEIDELEQKINWYNRGRSIGKIVIINTLLTITGIVVGIISLVVSIIK